MLKIAAINHTPEHKVSALMALQTELEGAINRFAESYGELPAVAVLGVLRLVEINFINRL